MKTLLYIMLFFSFSCAHYIQNMHKSFDNHKEKQRTYSLSEKYGKKRLGRLTTGNKKFVSPRIKRYYEPKSNITRRRYTASDFKDNRQDGSIWMSSSGRNREFIFSKNVNVQVGDIVLIQVQEKLKNEISSELEQALPPPQKMQNVSGENVTVKAAKKEAVKKVEIDDDKIFDIISSVVIDEVNSNHLMVKGEKEILFRNKKRLVTLQALVNRQHVEPDGSLASSKIIENQIQIVGRLE